MYAVCSLTSTCGEAFSMFLTHLFVFVYFSVFKDLRCFPCKIYHVESISSQLILLKVLVSHCLLKPPKLSIYNLEATPFPHCLLKPPKLNIYNLDVTPPIANWF